MDPLLLALLIAIALFALGGLVFAALAFRRAGRRDDGALAEAVRGAVREDLAAQSSAVRQDLSGQRSELTGQLAQQAQAAGERETALRTTLHEQLTGIRVENANRIQELTKANSDKHIELQAVLADQLTGIRRESGEQLQALAKSNADKHLELQAVLNAELTKLRQENEAKLEQMRATVDEKLQGTLEKRLGESFTLVSQRLEEVQKGLGEMQTLAQDVGGLKRVLTNVKSRGGWGETLLKNQLEDILTPEQYAENVSIRPGSGERVEFAVRLPGKDEANSVIYLPIDSKYPQEDYERLLDAQDRGERDEVEECARALERAILEQAKTISRKYIEPPFSTDFAIMYLPLEGLFAEVLRRNGLAARLQSEHRVLITGPTTLMSLLNSLQMGFRTLAIEKRSSEVWQVLGAAKAEFQKYGQVWDKLQKQLSTAQNTVNEASVRTRAIERKLRGVESIEQPGEAQAMIDDLLDDLEAEAPALEAGADD